MTLWLAIAGTVLTCVYAWLISRKADVLPPPTTESQRGTDA